MAPPVQVVQVHRSTNHLQPLPVAVVAVVVVAGLVAAVVVVVTGVVEAHLRCQVQLAFPHLVKPVVVMVAVANKNNDSTLSFKQSRVQSRHEYCSCNV
jgi:hypothetical protein